MRPAALLAPVLALVACGGPRSVAVRAPDPASLLGDVAKDPCAGSDIDLDALFSGKERKECTGKDLPADAAPDPALGYALKVELDPTTVSVAAGKPADVSVVLTNTDTAPLTLWFVGNLAVAPYVFGAHGERLVPAPVKDDCAAPPPPPPFARVILLPGGRARAHGHWDGMIPTPEVTPDEAAACPDGRPPRLVPAPAGNYRMVFPVPLLGRENLPPPPAVEVHVGP